jgi:hypothetical protein
MFEIVMMFSEYSRNSFQVSISAIQVRNLALSSCQISFRARSKVCLIYGKDVNVINKLMRVIVSTRGFLISRWFCHFDLVMPGHQLFPRLSSLGPSLSTYYSRWHYYSLLTFEFHPSEPGPRSIANLGIK